MKALALVATGVVGFYMGFKAGVAFIQQNQKIDEFVSFNLR